MELKNIKMTVAYDGTPFLGWQETPIGESVEGTLKKNLSQILQESYCLNGCSRTDRGVHAKFQVVSFFSRKKLALSQLKKSLNQLLPPTIRVLDLEEMPLSFHPTLDACAKEYTYTLYCDEVHLPFYQNTSWHIPKQLDIEKMKMASRVFLGRHDFKTFCNRRKNLVYETTVREIFAIDFEEKTPFLHIKIRADHFLYKMARTIVGTLVYVGLHKIKPESILEILEGKKRALAGVTAPAHGLCLTAVVYPDKIL